jgi:hypothetical protein
VICVWVYLACCALACVFLAALCAAASNDPPTHDTRPWWTDAEMDEWLKEIS